MTNQETTGSVRMAAASPNAVRCMIVNVQFRRHIREHSFQRDTAPIYASQLGGPVPPGPPPFLISIISRGSLPNRR